MSELNYIPGSSEEAEAAAHMKMSIPDFRVMMASIRQTAERERRGMAKMRREHWVREDKLQYLRNFKVTPHPHAGSRRGAWLVEPFTINIEQENVQRLRAILSTSSGGRFVIAGDYTQLKRDDVIVMSDTDDELLDLWELFAVLQISDAKRVLINGLGLGVALKMALACDHIEHVDVVELDPDVISLGDWLLGDPRVTVHQGDAYTYKFPAGTTWDVAWHDIWDEISLDNDFAKLHRRYGSRVRWQKSWAREVAVRQERRHQRELEKWQREIREMRERGELP